MKEGGRKKGNYVLRKGRRDGKGERKKKGKKGSRKGMGKGRREGERKRMQRERDIVQMLESDWSAKIPLCAQHCYQRWAWLL